MIECEHVNLHIFKTRQTELRTAQEFCPEFCPKFCPEFCPEYCPIFPYIPNPYWSVATLDIVKNNVVDVVVGIAAG